MRTIIIAAVIVILARASIEAQNTTNFATIGHVDRFDPGLDNLLAKDARIEVLCGGFEWAEGPVWVPEKANRFGGHVLFSDITEKSRAAMGSRSMPREGSSFVNMAIVVFRC